MDPAHYWRTDRSRTGFEGDERIVIDAAPDPLAALMEREEADLARGRVDTPEHRAEIERAARAIAAEAVRELVEFLFAMRGKRSEAFSFSTRASVAVKRATVIAWLFGISGIGTRPLSALAAELKCTRASLSHAANLARDQWGLVSGGSRSAKARVVYAERARRVWRREKAKRAPSATERNKERV